MSCIFLIQWKRVQGSKSFTSFTNALHIRYLCGQPKRHNTLCQHIYKSIISVISNNLSEQITRKVTPINDGCLVMLNFLKRNHTDREINFMSYNF